MPQNHCSERAECYKLLFCFMKTLQYVGTIKEDKFVKKNADAFYISINISGFILAFAAGWVDTFALHIFSDENISFMTGRVAKLGKKIFSGDADGIKSLLFIILSFMIGACLSAFITKRNGLCAGLYLSGIAIIITSAVILFLGSGAAVFTLVAIPFSMGAQNAATSLTPIGRTTHLTGPITDIGINIAKGDWRAVLFWAIRFSAFIFGTIMSYYVLTVLDSKSALFSLLLFVPGIIIILTGMFQKEMTAVPLPEN